jgi:hypothetical protein
LEACCNEQYNPQIVTVSSGGGFSTIRTASETGSVSELPYRLEEQVRVLISHRNLSQSPEDVVEDMLSHTLPGVLVVASMVAAIALLQAQGHYTYITV